MTGRKYLEPLIEHGTKIPNQNTSVYLPVVDFAKEVVVNIYEGNEYDEPLNEENVRIGEVHVPLDPPRPAEQCPIQVQFEYSEDGLITARAKDLTQNRSFGKVIDYSTGHLSEQDVSEVRALLTKIFGEAPPEVLPAGLPEPAAAPAKPGATPAAAKAAGAGAAKAAPAAAAPAAGGPEPDAPTEVKEAWARLTTADRVLAELGNSAEAGQLRALRNRLAAALEGITPLAEVIELEKQLAAELMFFDYLL
jgi:hypothetical protein